MRTKTIITFWSPKLDGDKKKIAEELLNSTAMLEAAKKQTKENAERLFKTEDTGHTVQVDIVRED